MSTVLMLAPILAVIVASVWLVTGWHQRTQQQRLEHDREMFKLREASDQANHRRWVETERVRAELTLPVPSADLERQARIAEAAAKKAGHDAEADKSRERLHNRRY